MKDYSIDADYKSRHRQHNTRRQISCQYGMIGAGTFGYVNLPIIPRLITVERKQSFGFYDLANGNYNPIEVVNVHGPGKYGGRSRNKKRFARRATTTMKGAIPLNKLNKKI